MIDDCRSGIGSWLFEFGGVTIRGLSERYAGICDLAIESRDCTLVFFISPGEAASLRGPPGCGQAA